MTKIYVISGFLGAGKTTLIQYLLQSVMHDKKVIVIENDFGRIEIDESILKTRPIQVENLNAGCICCSLRENFQKSLERAIAAKPDYILVEPSGVAHLSDVLEVILRFEDQGKAVYGKAISVLDAQRFIEYRKYYRALLDDQVEYADLILFSHQQGVNPIAKMQLVKLVRDQNPEAAVRTEEWKRIPASAYLHGMRGSHTLLLDIQSQILPPALPRQHKESKGGLIKSFFQRKKLSAVTLQCKKSFTMEELDRRLRRVTAAAGQSVLRCKGIVPSEEGYLLIQYISDELMIHPIPAEGNCICFIGTGLTEEKVHKQFFG